MTIFRVLFVFFSFFSLYLFVRFIFCSYQPPRKRIFMALYFFIISQGKMYIQKKNVMMWKLEERREYAIDEYYCVLVHIY
jgi:sensor histidine kinase YesM